MQAMSSDALWLVEPRARRVASLYKKSSVRVGWLTMKFLLGSAPTSESLGGSSTSSLVMPVAVEAAAKYSMVMDDLRGADMAV